MLHISNLISSLVHHKNKDIASKSGLKMSKFKRFCLGTCTCFKQIFISRLKDRSPCSQKHYYKILLRNYYNCSKNLEWHLVRPSFRTNGYRFSCLSHCFITKQSELENNVWKSQIECIKLLFFYLYVIRNDH